MSIMISGGNPSANTQPELVLGWKQRNTSPAIIHDIIGGGVAITAGTPRPRTGTLELFYMHESSAALAADMFRTGQMFILSDLAEPGSWKEMYFIVGEGGFDLTLDTVFQRWIVTVDYQEMQPS